MSEDDGFNLKNWVWIPDGSFFSKGYVTDYLPDGKCRVTITEGNADTNKTVDLSQLENCNPAKFNKCNDMAELTHLNEPSVVYNLYLRYNDDLIYTYSGLFLVAINPYKSLKIYDQDTLKKYHSHDVKEKPAPHIFAIAEGTYRNLLMNDKDQLILVTGESGAGKTENTKKIIQYLSLISSETSSTHDIDTKILQANPILESFGNAKTIKNNNSSRFGKFIKIYVLEKGSIDGANIEYYLLEKLRVVHLVKNERNYHVFYQLLKGNNGYVEKFKLNSNTKSYRYLKESQSTIPGVDDVKEFEFLKEAFSIVGFKHEEVEMIFQFMAIILHLGNLDFNLWKLEQATFTKDSPLSVIADLLGVSKSDLELNFVKPKVKAGRELVLKSRNASAVRYAIDAFAKYLYERIFQYIIQRINDNLDIVSSTSNYKFIGVLDIAGFEIFDMNSFEQLCINYTNEKLQQFFNHHSFILEQSEYLREDIQWEFIDFGQDLQPTIDLIELKSPMGIFSTLDEECLMPKSSDKSFMESLAKNWGNKQSLKFELNKIRSGFIVHHYAGRVEYNVENWLQKNTDPITDTLLQLLPKSSNDFVRELFENDPHLQPSNAVKRKLKTSSQKHKEQLLNLMDELEKTEPHFVRCILPNLDKKANKFEKQLVLTQLRCNGVLEGIRIARAGYPNKMTFSEFYQRYSILDVKEVFTKNMKTNSELIIKHINLDIDSYKIGITKIFFKNGVLGKLEELRDLSLKSLFTDFQSTIRGKSTRAVIKNKIKEIQAAQVLARNIQLIHESRKSNPWFDLFLNIKPLLEDSVKVLDLKKINESLKVLTTKLNDVESNNENLQAENSKLHTQVGKLEDEVMTTNGLIQERDKTLDSLKAEEKRLKGQIEKLNQEIKNTGEKLQESVAIKAVATEAHDKLKKKLEETLRAHVELTNKHAAGKKDIEILRKEKTQHLDQISKHQESIDILVKEHEQRTASLSESLKKKITDLSEELKNATGLKDNTLEKFNVLKNRLGEIESENADILSKHENVTKEKEELDRKNEILSKTLAEFKTTHENVSQKHDALVKENQSLLEKHEKMISDNSTVNAKYEEMAQQLKEYVAKSSEKEAQIESMRSEIQQHTKSIKEINNEKKSLANSQEDYETKLKHSEAEKLELKKKCNTLDREVSRLTKDLEQYGAKDLELKSLKKEHQLALNNLESAKADLAKAIEDKNNLHQTYEVLKVDADVNKKTVQDYATQILNLKSKVKELDESSIKNKENVPPDPSFVNEFASMKLKLNEQSAILRKEKFENTKLNEELKQLKLRLDANTDSLRRSATQRRSLALGEESGSLMNNLHNEIESLKFRIQQEETNTQRAETYAIELQKKLNRVQSSRGVGTPTDYEIKYKEAQSKIKEMEEKFQNMILPEGSPQKISKSESFGRTSLVNKTLDSANQDFVKIYQDVTKTLKTTREELSTSKSEILRLKALLRESEDELYDAKRQSFKTSVSDYESQLAQLNVRFDSLQSQNREVRGSLETYKSRSDEYFKKLELAESAITISRRHEQAAKTELEETKTQLHLSREEARATQILIRDVRRENLKLESMIADKEFQIKQSREQIKSLEERVEYFTQNYENIETVDKMREEIRVLHKDLNFKLETETNLVKESKKLQLDLEDMTRLKEGFEKDCEEQLAQIEELEGKTDDLSKRVRSLENDKIIHERKIGNFTKQVTSLKELLSELTKQKDILMEEKDRIEEDFLRLSHEHEETQSKLSQTESDMGILRTHLENQREVADSVRSELNQSKISNTHDIKDYQKLKNQLLVAMEENDSLQKTSKELKTKVNTLEEKLYSNEQLKFWEKKVEDLTKRLDDSENANHEYSQNVKNLERNVKKLEITAQNESQLSKKYNDENFDYQNKVNHLKSTIDILHGENLEKDLQLREADRERAAMKENMLLLETEVLQLREKLGI